MTQLRVLSLGGGTQSTVLALRAAEFGGVDCAIFADTGWEPKGVYANVEWLKTQLPYPIHVVKNDIDLLEACERGIEAHGGPGMAPPVFISNTPGEHGGITWRQCTRDFKVVPIKRKIREILGVGARARIEPGTVEQWLGLSADEAQRVSRSRDAYVTFRWPLVEVGLTRSAVIAWFNERYPGQPLPRSACVGCPFHSAREWVAVRKSDPEMWERTVAMDESLRNGRNIGLTTPAYLHTRCLPLNEAVDADEKMLKSRPSLFDTGDGWGNECGGHCGV